MSRKAAFPQRARHILIYDHDWELLSRVYGVAAPGAPGVGAAIRTIINHWCNRTRAAAGEASPALPEPIEIQDLEG